MLEHPERVNEKDKKTQRTEENVTIEKVNEQKTIHYIKKKCSMSNRIPDAWIVAI